MIISVASGKGGTGKTTIATSLALVAGPNTVYADCDVEEPNGHLFLKPSITRTERIKVRVPKVDLEKCTYCGKCQEVCRFNAIAVIPHSVMIFDELCHSCGGCLLACYERALFEDEREIGIIEQGEFDGGRFMHGKLNVGEAMSPPLIEAVRKRINNDQLTIIDAPPGTSCPVISSIQDTDACLLVTEPTPFGLYDLILAMELVRTLGLPFGVVINRDGIGDDRVERYCRKEQIPILAKIPDSLEIARAYSHGLIIPEAVPKTKEIFSRLLTEAVSLAQGRSAGAA